MPLLIMSFVFAFVGRVEVAGNEDELQRRFVKTVQKAVIGLQIAAERRPFRLKSMNESLKKTARAAYFMISGRNDEALFLLDAAKQDYSSNHFAIFLQAFLKEQIGETREANRLYETFLLNSRTFTQFEKVFIKWGDFHLLRRIVYEMLQDRGVSFEGREHQIEARVPFGHLLEYTMNSEGIDYALNVSFIISLMGGGILLVVSRVIDFDLHGSFLSQLPMFYLWLWVAYFIWIVDLAFGLPFRLSRFQAAPAVLGFALITHLGLAVSAFLKRRKVVLEEGFLRCPHCKAVIVQLATKCSQCHQALDK